MRRLALLTPLLAASAALANMPPPQRECARDEECALTQWAGCCGTCCPVEAYPVAKDELARRRNVCAAVDCEPLACKPTPCAPGGDGSGFVAACRLGRCVKMSREDVEPPPPPRRPVDFCAGNADCVVSTFGCCGGCCEPPPQAMTRAELSQRQRACARKKCREPDDCSRVRCAKQPPASDFQAVCRANRCELTPVTPPGGAECREDLDCMVTYPQPPPSAACHRSACGCCPGTEAVAVPRRSTPVRQQPPPPPPPQQSPRQTTPPFGLSTGNTAGGPPAPPQCAPCPPRPPARAVCRAGRCEAQTVRHLRK